MFADCLFHFANQAFADALVLVFGAHGQIGQVAAVAEIGQRAGNADGLFAVPRGDDEIGVTVHLADAVNILNGTFDAAALVNSDDVVDFGAALVVGNGHCAFLLRFFKGGTVSCIE